MSTRTRLLTTGFALAFVLSAGVRVASAQAPPFPACETPSSQALVQYEICEVVIHQRTYLTNESAYLQPDVKAEFTHDGRTWIVHGFHDIEPGSSEVVFKIRFNMSEPGEWTYVIKCTMQSDPNQTCPVNGPSRTFTVDASGHRGFLRRDPDRPTTFVYDDGFHPFIWGQTYYQIVNYARTHNTGLWHPSVTNSADYGMNKIRLVVSPWSGDARPRHNVESKAFLRDGANGALNRDRLDLDHWRALDEVVSYLDGQAMIADLILFHDGNESQTPYAVCSGQNVVCPQNERYTRHTVARYAAFPNVIWTLSNEYQLVTGASPANNERWNQLGCLIRGGCGAYDIGMDPWIVNGAFWRPLSNQNNINTLNGSYPCFEFFTEGWPGHISLQTRRANAARQASIAVSRNSNLADPNPCQGLSQSTRLPVIDDEYYYIGTDSDRARDRNRHRQAVWSIAMRGGFGSTGSLSGPEDCPANADGDRRCSPTMYTDWINEPAPYGDIRKVTNFFRNTLNGVWWQMDPSSRVSTVGNTSTYALEGPNQVVAYVVSEEGNTEGTGKFTVSGLPIGTYTHSSDDPTGETPQGLKDKRVTGHSNLTQFVTPRLAGWSDWVSLIRPKSGVITPAEETVWVWDSVPTGAITGGDSESWNWMDDEPTPISDSLAHQSSVVTGMHQHYFYGATETLAVSAGNVLFAYVYLDSLNPPNEVMLQWNDGTWEHRAYWGANQLGWGVDGTNSRRYMGPLPARAQWVRLQVPASLVGLEGRTLNGMAFTLVGGKATWDDAGKTGHSEPVCDPGTIVQQPQNQTITVGESTTLSTAAAGTGRFNYQWYQAPSGVFQNPVGFGQQTLNTGPLTTTKPYWAHITDTCVGAFLFSNTAIVTVRCTASPSITVPPTSRTINPGQSTTLSVGATQAVSYQWYQGDAPSTTGLIPGATGPLLTVAPGSTTQYWVRVTNSCGIANSDTATVCVMPAITAHPTPRTINPGQSTTLTVSVVNAATYQWYQGTAPSTTTPVGGNSSSLTVSPIVTTSYWVRASNACGSVNSSTATVTVAPLPPPQITRMQSSFALANSQTSITANWPQPTQPGTFLVAVLSAVVNPNGFITFTPPTGWSHAVTSEWTNVKLAIYYRPNNGGARTSETFSVSPGFHDMTLDVLEYSGIAAANPLDKTGLAGSETNSGYVQTGFTANTAQAKELVITALTTNTQTEFSTVPVDGYTEVYDKYMLFYLTTAMYERITTSVGSYGHGATVIVPAQWVGLVATFKGS